MDAIDILGSVLGHKKGGSGRGADILRDILRGGPARSPRQTAPSRREPKPESRDLKRDAQELEDLLNVANQRDERRTKPTSRPRQESAPTRSQAPRSPSTDIVDADSDRALILARAMINAAKSDGSLTQSETMAILKRLGDTSADTIDFLQAELAKPLDVMDFAMSVPIGMERQVYMLSLIAIDLDTNQEIKYLRTLSKALRIPDKTRAEIHEEVGAPPI